MIARSDQSVSEVQADGLSSEILSGEAGNNIFTYDEVSYLTTCPPIKDTDRILVSDVLTSETFAPINRLILALVLTIVIMLLLGCLFTFLVSYGLCKPI